MARVKELALNAIKFHNPIKYIFEEDRLTRSTYKLKAATATTTNNMTITVTFTLLCRTLPLESLEVDSAMQQNIQSSWHILYVCHPPLIH